jgi:hypothetical protein
MTTAHPESLLDLPPDGRSEDGVEWDYPYVAWRPEAQPCPHCASSDLDHRRW